MEPLMRKASGPLWLRQVDDHGVGLEECRCKTTLTPGPESKSQRPVKGYGVRWNTEHVGQIHESIICLVEHPLAFLGIASLLDPVAELRPAEPERIDEHLG